MGYDEAYGYGRLRRKTQGGHNHKGNNLKWRTKIIRAGRMKGCSNCLDIARRKKSSKLADIYNNVNRLRVREFIAAEKGRKKKREKREFLGEDNAATKLEVEKQTLKNIGADIGGFT